MNDPYPTRLFHKLLTVLQPSVVMDIGSMDGSESETFSNLLPKAKVIAFEANPHNYKNISKRFHSKPHFKVENQAVTNHNNQVSFYIVETSKHNKGMSSLYKRPDQKNIRQTKVTVPATRIDSYITKENLHKEKIALWIDVEGAGYEALEGCLKMRSNISVIHIEAEIRPIINPKQKLYSDIITLLKENNFTLLFGNHLLNSLYEQIDLVFINNQYLVTLPQSIQKEIFFFNIRFLLMDLQNMYKILTRKIKKYKLFILDSIYLFRMKFIKNIQQ